MKHRMIILLCFIAPLAFSQNSKTGAGLDMRPQWIDTPQKYAKQVYENGNTAASSNWYYDVGVSAPRMTEARARKQALLNVQTNFSAYITSEFIVHLNLSNILVFRGIDTVVWGHLIERAVTYSIKIGIPRFDILEWYVIDGVENGKQWYVAYVLTRFDRSEMIRALNSIDAEEVISNLESLVYDALPPRDSEIEYEPFSESEYYALVEQVSEIREYTIKGIEKGEK